MAVWHTVESARSQWADAPTDEDDEAPDASLEELLSVAKLAVRAYAPALPDEGGLIIDEDGYIVPAEGSEIPDNYRVAQLMQARNIWNAAKASPSGGFDNGEYGLQSFPLDWQIRQLLRPKRGLPAIS